MEIFGPIRRYPFKVLDDDKMQELIDSISVNGILTPVLVRPLGMDTYEMISGHRRMHAAKIVGLTKIPTIIREMTDDEAVINMVDANVQREELLPSEKAFAYRMKLDAMKRQAGRPGKNNVSQNETNLRSDEILAKEIGTSKDGNMEVYKSNFSRFEKQTSRIPQDKLQEVRISNSNNNKFNDTYRNNIKSVHIPSEEGECQNRVGRYEGIDDYAATKELIKEHIEYDVLMQDYPSNQELVQGIFELILETVLYTGNKVIIASNEYPAEIVKNRFMKINYMHIQYVMECLRKNTTQVKNIKKYLLAALFNAPVTMQGYYQAEVNHAMPQFANNK